MAYPPRAWRAETGYQAIAPPPPPTGPGIMFYPWQQQPIQYVPGPVGVYDISQAMLGMPPPYPGLSLPPPPPPPRPPPTKEQLKACKPPPKEAKKEDEEKRDKKEEKKEENQKKPRRAPPSLTPGMNYMFPPSHTKLHIFRSSGSIWKSKYAGMDL
ncbi:hypothetical protein LTR62_002478 [Meristemomyces frigidus]|uniref:Uncharacterized protein n=1 Tax=Meristemomyces frigidus TaxID=1508187 RepID=A0AAN7TSZ8_9PEZI|nr:hypothetical protein LTR62_002478 [Meristemomyces frigidus]